MTPNNEWEEVSSPTAGDYIERMKVAGGFLYRTYFVNVNIDDTVTAAAMVFVPNKEATEL